MLALTCNVYCVVCIMTCHVMMCKMSIGFTHLKRTSAMFESLRKKQKSVCCQSNYLLLVILVFLGLQLFIGAYSSLKL